MTTDKKLLPSRLPEPTMHTAAPVSVDGYNLTAIIAMMGGRWEHVANFELRYAKHEFLERDKANAEFAARAWNAHYPLVLAVRDMATFISCCGEYSGMCAAEKNSILERAAKVLAEATTLTTPMMAEGSHEKN